MPDVFTPAKRSAVMSLIRSTGNAATELRLRALLRAEKITGWRRHVPLTLPASSIRSSPGSPKSDSKAKAKATTPATNLKSKAKAKARNAKKSSATTRATQPAAPPRRPRLPRVRPDFVFRAERLVIFVDGCFWHGCPRHATRPKQNRKFWDEKIARNRRRDRLVTRELRHQGWTVLRLWECSLTKKRLPHTLGRLRRALAL